MWSFEDVINILSFILSVTCACLSLSLYIYIYIYIHTYTYTLFVYNMYNVVNL